MISAKSPNSMIMQTNDHTTCDYSAVLESKYGAHGTPERDKFDEKAYGFYTSSFFYVSYSKQKPYLCAKYQTL